MTPLLSAHQLGIAIGERILCRELDFSLAPGEILAILGANGSGKTTLLQTLAGLRPPIHGQVQLAGRPYAEWSLREAARQRAFLPQLQPDHFASSVLETVLVGRHPHLDRWQWESAADLAIARDALAAVGLSGLAERDIQTLSGGERQRVAIAALLAQQPAVYLLDEPLNHLDLHHQITTLQLLRAEAASGRAVILVLHDLNLAARFADNILLLDGRGGSHHGRRDDILRADLLSSVFGHPLTQIDSAGGICFLPD